MKPKVLVIDDDVALPHFIKKSHFMSSFDIEITANGNQGLEAIKKTPFEFFILDFMLPDLTGIELCKIIKEDPLYKKTPVLFITSLDETSKMIDAFKVGAVDYIVKPIVMEELAIRVRTHLSAYQSAKKLEKFAVDMEKLAHERAEQLIHTDRLASLGILSAGLAHEIRNPATFISGNIQTLDKFWEILSPLVKNCMEDSNNNKQLQYIYDEMPGLIYGIKDGVSRIRNVIDGLRAFSRKKSSAKEIITVAERIENALSLCNEALKNNIDVKKAIPEEAVFIQGNPQQIEQVLINLFMNAADAMGTKSDSLLSINVVRNEEKVYIEVEDNGPGIPNDMMKNIWDPFFTTKPAGKGTGLGLPICQSIIQAHQGQIFTQKKQEEGMKFVIELPLHRN